ncbi:MAG: transposase, partial [Cellvibrionaceae bacterium]|nr:transposase [Cellvibrionaceae bacterium]
MPKPRKHIVSLDATPYYHCTSRCVRRAFLCGFDQLTGQSYEHRRQWLEDRILLLGQVFAIDICAYAVMHNHHHVVLHINKAQSLSWSDQEVCQRWHQLYKGTSLTQKFLNAEPLSEVELDVVKAKLGEWRLHLCSISWFMRALNEPIARMANTEDKCTGKFWESRFKSQALLDHKALLACIAYVDLNPVRAKIAPTPEVSDHTSIKMRVNAVKHNKNQPKP